MVDTPQLDVNIDAYALHQNLSPGDLLFNMRWNVYLARGTPSYIDRIRDLKSFVESHPKIIDDKEYKEDIAKTVYEKPDPDKIIIANRTPGGDPSKVPMIQETDWDAVLYAIDKVCGKYNLTWVSMPVEVL